VKSRSWQLLLGLALGVGLLLFALRGVDLHALWYALAHANYWLLAPIIGLTLLAFYVRAVRWGVLLRTVKAAIPAGNLFSATMIGFAANNLLPARLGEFIRAWAIGRSERISRSAAFATVVVERIVDVFALLFFFCLALLLHPFTETVRRGGWMLLGVNFLLLLVLVLAERHPERVSAFSRWAGGHLPGKIGARVHALLDNFVVGLGVLRQGPAIGWVIVYSLLMYGLTLASIQAALAAFSFHVPWYASIVLLVSTSLGIIVAPTPGYVGAMQVACVWGLSLFGIDKSRAFSFSLYYHVSQFIPITLLGLWYLARQGLSLGDVAGAAGKEASEAA
jgi:uncharacterized protein (TIRG00374 family)